MLSIIVAISKNNAIGKDNKLLWHLPDDLKRFKKMTTGHNIIMGKKTFESLGRVLPNRHHIVLSRDANFKIDNENVEILNDVALLKKYINSDEENFVIGGGSVYKLLMPYSQKMYITKINKEFDGDVYFPEINYKEWKITNQEPGPECDENLFEYEYVTYERI